LHYVKAHTFVFSLLILCSSVAYSQTPAKPVPGNAKGAQILVGAVAGANYSWTSFGDRDYKDLYKVRPVFGYHFGGHISFRVRKRFFLHTSIIYSTKGMTMEGKKDDFTTTQDLGYLTAKYNYLEMPIVYTTYFKGSFGKSSFKYSLGIGPNVSYWLGGKGTIENFDTHERSTGVVDYKIVFNKNPFDATEHEMVVEKPTRVQLGLNFAAGLLFEPSRDHQMIVTFRYELGHSYLSRESVGSFGPTYFEQPLQMRNQGFRISVAYLIDLKVDQRKKGKSTIKKSSRNR
jgi:hypothetical protein